MFIFHSDVYHFIIYIVYDLLYLFYYLDSSIKYNFEYTNSQVFEHFTNHIFITVSEAWLHYSNKYKNIIWALMINDICNSIT